MEQVQKEENREINREVKFYNLDMIISIGYRVNSAKATQFRIWSTKILKVTWKRSTKKDGKVAWKINNPIVGEYKGISKLRDSINQVMLITNYALSSLE